MIQNQTLAHFLILSVLKNTPTCLNSNLHAKINAMPKNIMILIPTLTDGGGERVAADLSLELTRAGHKIFLTLFDGNQGQDYKYNGKLINLNLPAHGNYLVKIITFIKRILAVRKLKKGHKIEVTISFMEAANHVNLLSKINDQIIISIHTSLSSNYSGLLSAIYRIFIKITYNHKTDSIVTVSNGIKNDLIENFSIKKNLVHTIYNGINLDNIKQNAQEPLDEKYHELFLTKEIFITAGRLTEAKGQWHLLKVFSEYKKTGGQEKLIILGDGELYERLMKLANGLNLSTYSFRENKEITVDYDVYFLGFLKNPFKFFKAAKIFICSSLYEGFGNTLVEAMACGTPVISADCDFGPREILTANNKDVSKKTKTIEKVEYGYLLPVFDKKWRKANTPISETEKIWINALQQLSENHNSLKQYSQISHQRATDFSKEKTMQRWIKIIELICPPKTVQVK